MNDERYWVSLPLERCQVRPSVCGCTGFEHLGPGGFQNLRRPDPTSGPRGRKNHSLGPHGLAVDPWDPQEFSEKNAPHPLAKAFRLLSQHARVRGPQETAPQL